MKSILLTRSKFANIPIKNALREKYELLECNLINYELQDLDLLKFYKFRYVIVTSFFTANKLPRLNNNIDMSVWVVGKNSAEILAAKGYNIMFVASCASDLYERLPKDIYRDTIYPSSNKVTINMPCAITRKIFYKVFYKKSLLQTQIVRYKEGLDYILLYSQNSARTLLKLLLKNNLINYLQETKLIVISSKIAKLIRPYFYRIEIIEDTNLILKYFKQ